MGTDSARAEAHRQVFHLVNTYSTVTPAVAVAAVLKDADGKRDAGDLSDDDFLSTVLGAADAIRGDRP